jgi:hypothetical protein
LYRPIILIYFVLEIFTIPAESEKTQVSWKYTWFCFYYANK